MNFDNQASKLYKGLIKLNAEFPDFNVEDINTVDDIIENSLYCFGKLVELKEQLKNRDYHIDSNQEFINDVLSKTKIKDLLTE